MSKPNKKKLEKKRKLRKNFELRRNINKHLPSKMVEEKVEVKDGDKVLGVKTILVKKKKPTGHMHTRNFITKQVKVGYPGSKKNRVSKKQKATEAKARIEARAVQTASNN